MTVARSLQGAMVAYRPVAWYKFGVGLTIAAGKVSAWADYSGNKHPLLQAVGAAQPLADGKGGITCDGIATFMQSAFTLNQPCTFALMLNQIAWTGSNVLMDGAGTNNTGAIIQTTASPQINLSAGTSACAQTGATVGQWKSVISVCNGANSALYAESLTGATGNAGAGNPAGITIGAEGDGLTVFGNVGVREVLIFNSALNDQSIRLVRKYLEAQRGIFYN